MAAIVHPKLAKACFEKSIQPLLDSPDKYEMVGIKLLSFSYPYLDVELNWHAIGNNINLRLDGSDYPYRPVSGYWIHADGTPLYRGTGLVPEGGGFHTLWHDQSQKCWFCFKGWSEYHNHVSHQDISWASIRQDSRFSVLQLIMQLTKDLNNPGVNRV